MFVFIGQIDFRTDQSNLRAMVQALLIRAFRHRRFSAGLVPISRIFRAASMSSISRVCPHKPNGCPQAAWPHRCGIQRTPPCPSINGFQRICRLDRDQIAHKPAVFLALQTFSGGRQRFAPTRRAQFAVFANVRPYPDR